jgi:hypothetical protein
MKTSIVLVICAGLFLSCANHDRNKPTAASNLPVGDTVVGKKTITGELAGSAYRKRATAYFIISGSDTSDYSVFFTENKDDGKVSIITQYDLYNKKGKLYSTRREEFKRILPVAGKEYNLDSLTGIEIGRLISTGDLDVEISKELLTKFGDHYKISNYREISDFLLNSSLTRDINDLFAPFSVVIKQVIVEKVFFTDKKDLYISSLVKTDSSEIPPRLLDCITWLQVEKIKQVR